MPDRGNAPVELIIGVIVGQYERAWISHMMTCLNEPISLQLSADSYYGEIAKQLGNACFGGTTILRLFQETADGIDHNALICVAAHDAGRQRHELSTFNIEKDQSPAFGLYHEFAQRFNEEPA